MILMAVTSRLVSVATLGVLCAFTAVANPIFVFNFSFETIVGGLGNANCGSGCSYSTNEAIPGWNNTPTGLNALGGSGQFQPGNPANTTYFDTLSDGPTHAYSNGGVTFSQTVAQAVQLGITYTLIVDFGQRKDVVSPPLMASADLLINGVRRTATGTAPGPGLWSPFTVSYTTTSADLGKSITIELTSTGSQANFDNVRLSDNAPEPAGVTLLGLGLAGLLVFARRKRVS